MTDATDAKLYSIGLTENEMTEIRDGLDRILGNESTRSVLECIEREGFATLRQILRWRLSGRY